MKKLLGITTIATVLCFAIVGCSQPTEGDPAPATSTSATGTTTGASPDNNSGALNPPPTGGTTTGN